MKIGIDISQIVYGTGVSFYTKNLVENLLKIDQENEYTLFFSSLRQSLEKSQELRVKREELGERRQESALSTQNSELRTFRIPPSLLEPLWNKWHILPIENFIGSIDVFHSSDWTQPPTKAAKVTTIHDFGFIKYPKTAHPKIKAVMSRRFKWIKREVDLIIAISEATKKDIIEILGIPEEKIRVVYEATPTDINRIEDQKVIDKVKKKFGIKGDYLLTVATLEPRKNLKKIIEAFSKLRTQNSSLRLVIVGKPGWGDMSEEIGDGRQETGVRGLESGVIFTGYVSREELSSLYSGASCFVFPSLYEGFGLPILEAMKCGCPVVTSNLSSMPEVAGEAGILVNPLDVKGIARGINEVIGDKERRESLIKKGFEQAKKFSWEKTAKETLRIYHEVIEK